MYFVSHMCVHESYIQLWFTSHEQDLTHGIQGKHRIQGASQEMSGRGHQTAHRSFIDGVQDQQLSVSLQHESLLRRSITPSEGQITHTRYVPHLPHRRVSIPSTSFCIVLETLIILYPLPGNLIESKILPKRINHHMFPWMTTTRMVTQKAEAVGQQRYKVAVSYQAQQESH